MPGAVASMELQADTDSDVLSILSMNEDIKALRVYAVSIATADTDSDGLSILSMNKAASACGEAASIPVLGNRHLTVRSKNG